MKATERQLQRSMVDWFRLTQKGIIFAIPNGGSRNKIEGANLKKDGVLAGVADLCTLLPSRTIFVEVKTKKGAQSKEQKAFEDNCKRMGSEYHLVRSLETFMDVVVK